MMITSPPVCSEEYIILKFKHYDWCTMHYMNIEVCNGSEIHR